MNRSKRKLNRRRQALSVFFILTTLLAGLSLNTPQSAAQTRSQDPNRLLVQTPAGSTASPTNGNRFALVLGNGAYTNAPVLKNPTNDAADMAASLGKLGFNVAHDINLNQRKMKFLIREFVRKLKDGGQGLFYFAGHGVQLRGRNYLIPVDADIQSEADVEDQGVDVNFLMGLMDEAGNGLNVIILDACRNNPFARSFRATTRGLAQLDAPTGTLIAYATAPGQVASDGAERNGAYTAELLQQLSVPGLPVEELMKRVRANLMRKTNGQQIPWESSSLVGDFVINRPSAADAAKAANLAALATPPAIEQEFWDSIKASADPEDFRAYLKEFPTGPHAPIARNNVRRLDIAKNDGGRPGPTASGRTGDTPASTPSASRDSKIQRSYDLWRAGDYEESINLATQAITAEPNTADGYLIRGTARLFRLELAPALLDFNEVLRWQPKNALALRWRAMTYRGLNLDSLAQKDLAIVEQLTNTPVEAWEFEARGYARYQKSSYDAALSDFTQAIKLDPQYLVAYVFRDAARWFKDTSISVFPDIAEAIRINPKFAGAYLYRGLLTYIESAKRQQSIDDFSAAIKLAPNALLAYRFRAQQYGMLEKHDLAIKDFSAAIRLGSESDLPARARSYSKIGNHANAIEDYSAYIRYAPAEKGTYSERARVYLKVNDPQSALRDYNEYIRLDPKYYQGYEERAKLYRQLNRIPEAEADERKAKELKP